MTDASDGEVDRWQPRFYAATGVSAALLAGLNFWLFPMNWMGGFAVGFGVAGAIACFMLAIQSLAINPTDGEYHV